MLAEQLEDPGITPARWGSCSVCSDPENNKPLQHERHPLLRAIDDG